MFYFDGFGTEKIWVAYGCFKSVFTFVDVDYAKAEEHGIDEQER